MNHLCLANPWSSSSRPFRVTAEAIIFTLLLLAAPGFGQQFENDKLLTHDCDEYDDFGYSVALDDGRALVGAYWANGNCDYSGAAHVFRHDEVADTWTEEAKLIASDGAYADVFGWAVALDGARALISARGDDDYGYAGGSAYVFGYDSASGTWQEEAKLIPSDGGGLGTFGSSVALSGDRALVGAEWDNDNGAFSGSAYVFCYDSLSGTWHQEAKLLASDGTDYAVFGWSVIVSGDRALIGACGDVGNGNDSGSAYVFRYDSASGDWQEEAKLIPSDGSTGDSFGWTVSLSGDRALIGAPYEDANGICSGSAYLFGYDSVSGTWHEETKLTASDGGYLKCFGKSVALFGDRALLGAPGDDTNGSFIGSTYLFSYDSASGIWQEEAILRASDGTGGEEFGISVALCDDRALVGANEDDNENGVESGAAYAFDFASILSLDVKCNGEDQNVIVDSGENVTLTIDIDNGYHPDLKGDFWIVAILPISGWNTWTYGPWANPVWRLGAGNEYYTGPPLNHAVTVCDQPLPPGNYKLYLAMDAIPNGVLNLTALWDFDVVDFVVQ